MPPRPFRERPERREQRVRKHVAQAQEYWAKGHAHLREQDTCQAAEEGWGTVAQLAKAVATLREWNHYDHIAVRECVIAPNEENPDREREFRRGLFVTEGLHGQFYEVFNGPCQRPGCPRRHRSTAGNPVAAPVERIYWWNYTGGSQFIERSEI